MGIVDVAAKEVGVTEVDNNNNVKYNTWYYGRAVSGDAYPWCAVFVSWCANQCGELNALGGKTAAVSVFESRFRSMGIFHAKGSGYTPVAGDIFIHSSNGSSHTGIVTSCDGSKYYTIEGNTGNPCVKVAVCSYAMNYKGLTGWGHPNYGSSAGSYSGSSTSGEDASTGSSSSSTSASLGLSIDYKTYTCKSGDTLDSVAVKFSTTDSMLAFLNNITVGTTLKAGQTLVVPKNNSSATYSVTGSKGITKKHTSSVTVSYPVMTCEFYAEGGVLSAVAENEGILADSKLHSDIISITTNRSMGDDCPTFSISLVYGNNWYNNLSSNDLVVISMQRPPETKRCVFIGLIDDIRRTTSYASGTPTRTVQVTGRGLNKAFVNFQVGVVENMLTTSEAGFMDGLLALQYCTSAEAFKSIIKAYVGKGLDYKWCTSTSTVKKFSDFFSYKLSCHENEMYGDSSSLLQYNGSMWEFLKEFSNSPFDETYWEVEGRKATLIHRKTPFSAADWKKLAANRITIKDEDIIEDSLGRSDLETYTLFRLAYSFDDALSAGYNPLWYKPMYEKYGINMLQVSTSYLTMNSEGTTNSDGIKDFLIDLYNWNVKNNVFSNGSITVKGKAAYKVGEVVILESENMEFYVEGVSHSFTEFGTWKTTLSLTRGIQPEKRFTPPYDEYDEFTDKCAQSIIDQTSGSKIDWMQVKNVTVPGASYDTGTGEEVGGGTGGTISTSQTLSNENQIYYYLHNTKGWNKAVSIGILANIYAETNFNPSASGDNGTSYGLCGWHLTRKTALLNYLKQRGLSTGSIVGQLDFLLQEAPSYKSFYSAMQNAPDTQAGAYNVAYNMCVYYEVPASKYQKAVERGNLAKNTFWNKH